MLHPQGLFQAGQKNLDTTPLGLRAALLFAGLILAGCLGAASAAEYRAFWVDTWGTGILSQSQVDDLLGVPGTSTKGQIRDANCNAVIVEVRRNCDACYPSSMGEPYMSGLSPANFNALQAVINAAHDTTGGKKRIEVHCWIVTFRTSGGTVYSQHSDPPTGSLTDLDNYWPSRDDAGAEVSDKAFDPGHPLALQYTVNVAMDLVNNFDIDGIHYDYIRFTANNQGYNPTSIARYNARYGLAGQPAASNEQFKQWRRDQVTAVVRQVYARIQKSKPWVKQSGSFVTWNPSPTASTRAAFQATRPYYDVYSDWDSWMQEGIVDMAVPMTYYNWASLPADYTRWMDFEKDRKFNRHMIVGPGTYLNSLANAILELQLTRDASPAGNYAQGFSGYSYRVPYNGGTWSGFSPSLVSQVTPTWDDVPTMPWKTSPTNGHMMGTVTISPGGMWADGAKVTITGPANRTQTNDGTGFYAFIDLPPGSYEVTASMAGFVPASATVNVAIGAVTGNMYEQNLVLTTNVPPASPSIITEPADRVAFVGQTVAFTVTANGEAPLAYQWQFNGDNLAGETTDQLVRTNIQISLAGGYRVVITNTHGAVTSRVASLVVHSACLPVGVTPLWSLPPGSRSYLTVNALPYERGMACNPVTQRLLVASRNGPHVYVLNANDGADLHELNVSGISGGTYSLLMVGAADDGVVYAGNLTTAGTTTAFKLYRWANDSPGAVPVVAYSGDPGAGNNQRWGDTLDLRGAGTNTQIILAARSGNVVAILTTVNGTNFTAQLVTVADAPAGAFGLGLTFGAGNTFWGKATSQNLRQVAFDLVAGTGTTIRNHADPGFPATVAPIGMSVPLNLLGGVHVGVTGNNLRLYDLTTTNGTPVALATNVFASDNENTQTGTGAVDFSDARVYALGANNGLLALEIQCAVPVQPAHFETITELSDGRIRLLWTGAAGGSYTLQAATNVNFSSWSALGPVSGSNGWFNYVDDDSTNLPRRFYRAKQN